MALSSSDESVDREQIFRSNTLMIIIPGLLFGAALILRNQENLYVLKWVLIGIGLVTTIAIVSSFTTLAITEQNIRIKNLRQNYDIHVDDIARQQKTVSTSKGIESIVWKLHLKNGSIVKISSDLFKEKERLKESLNRFLKNVSKK
ncbi:hypothetical protein [Ekhidna sp.]|uniref:hypothetical protein n=1 Tax=Ekhidna sp. TaxID=2608089 RepID=UPI003CCBBDFD